MEQRFGPAVDQELLDKVIGDAYREALKVQSLEPISEGQVEDVDYKPREDLTFSISFDVQPVIELERLGGFTVERPKIEVAEEDIDRVLDRLRDQAGVWKPLEDGEARGREPGDAGDPAPGGGRARRRRPALRDRPWGR